MSRIGIPFKSGLHEWLKADPEHQFEYLRASVEENSDVPAAILMALKDIAEVRGYESLAAEAGLSKKALYKILSPEKDAKPRLETVHQILNALGAQLTVRRIAK